MVRINSSLSIPESEISFTFSRSSGPGGQNVNKLNTRATLRFDVARSPSLSDAQRDRILEKLPTRISREGILRVVSQKHRTQKMNRDAATERFAELLRDALVRRRPRKKRGIPAGVRRKRLEDKRRRSRLKTGRTRPSESDD
ncbi:MAG: aminoacyl-tRNA hydrolase [Candidatus Krumholzibacteria bacterium]|nr:aminoacyl-tRNA hydrolase [Candidatus Krumholzibacteria bacterium]